MTLQTIPAQRKRRDTRELLFGEGFSDSRIVLESPCLESPCRTISRLVRYGFGFQGQFVDTQRKHIDQLVSEFGDSALKLGENYTELDTTVRLVRDRLGAVQNIEQLRMNLFLRSIVNRIRAENKALVEPGNEKVRDLPLPFSKYRTRIIPDIEKDERYDYVTSKLPRHSASNAIQLLFYGMASKLGWIEAFDYPETSQKGMHWVQNSYSEEGLVLEACMRILKPEESVDRDEHSLFSKADFSDGWEMYVGKKSFEIIVKRFLEQQKSQKNGWHPTSVDFSGISGINTSTSILDVRDALASFHQPNESYEFLRYGANPKRVLGDKQAAGLFLAQSISYLGQDLVSQNAEPGLYRPFSHSIVSNRVVEVLKGMQKQHGAELLFIHVGRNINLKNLYGKSDPANYIITLNEPLSRVFPRVECK